MQQLIWWSTVKNLSHPFYIIYECWFKIVFGKSDYVVWRLLSRFPYTLLTDLKGETIIFWVNYPLDSYIVFHVLVFWISTPMHRDALILAAHDVVAQLPNSAQLADLKPANVSWWLSWYPSMW